MSAFVPIADMGGQIAWRMGHKKTPGLCPGVKRQNLQLKAQRLLASVS